MLECCAQSATWSVGDGGDFSRICAAVEAAGIGDIIEIRSGQYHESVNLTKTVILQGVDSGRGRPVIIAPIGEDGLSISVDGIWIKNLEITGARDWSRAALKISSDNNTIEGCMLSGSCVGLLMTGYNNTLSSNGICRNDLGGAVLLGSDGNILSENKVYENNHAGILLIDSSNNSLKDNNASLNMGIGIKISGASGNAIIGNLVDTNDYGIVLSDTAENLVSKNLATNNDYGIYPYRSEHNRVSDNLCTRNDYAIYLYESDQNTIENNTLAANDGYGAILYYCRSNVLAANDVRQNQEGAIKLQSSHANTLLGNVISQTIDGTGISLQESDKNNVSSNRIDLSSEWGMSILAGSNNTIAGNLLEGNGIGGIGLTLTKGNLLAQNSVADSPNALVLDNSSLNAIRENQIQRISRQGAYLLRSSGNQLMGNAVNRSTQAIYLNESDGNNLTSNSIRQCEVGIGLASSHENRVYFCTIEQGKTGLVLNGASHNNITGCHMQVSDNGISLVNSARNRIRANHAHASSTGIGLERSSQNNVTENQVGGSMYAIRLDLSAENLLAMNNLTENTYALCLDEGIYPAESSGNRIVLNTFAGNLYHVQSFISSNVWTTPEMNYTYRGRLFYGSLGNFWEDDRRTDGNDDGVCDHPHTMGAEEDSCPLIQPFPNYRWEVLYD